MLLPFSRLKKLHICAYISIFNNHQAIFPQFTCQTWLETSCVPPAPLSNNIFPCRRVTCHFFLIASWSLHGRLPHSVPALYPLSPCAWVMPLQALHSLIFKWNGIAVRPHEMLQLPNTSVGSWLRWRPLSLPCTLGLAADTCAELAWMHGQACAVRAGIDGWIMFPGMRQRGHSALPCSCGLCCFPEMACFTVSEIHRCLLTFACLSLCHPLPHCPLASVSGTGLCLLGSPRDLRPRSHLPFVSCGRVGGGVYWESGFGCC